MNIPLLGWTDGNRVEMDLEAYEALRPLPTPEELNRIDAQNRHFFMKKNPDCPWSRPGSRN